MNYEAKSRRKLPRDETLKITTNTRRPRTTRPSAERRACKARFAQYFSIAMENLFKICIMDRPDLLGTRAREHSIPTSLKESPNLRATWIRCETFPVYPSYIKPRRCSQHDGQDSQIACGEFGLKPRLAKYQSFSPRFRRQSPIGKHRFSKLVPNLLSCSATTEEASGVLLEAFLTNIRYSLHLYSPELSSVPESPVILLSPSERPSFPQSTTSFSVFLPSNMRRISRYACMGQAHRPSDSVELFTRGATEGFRENH
jgi:hypothetical protein